MSKSIKNRQAATTGRLLREPVDLRDKPLPEPKSSLDTDDYQRVEVDKAAPEHGELLVDLRRYGIASESFYARKDGLNAPLYRQFRTAMKSVYVRKGVAEKLAEVNRILADYGVEVLVLDGFRPVCVQAELWKWNIELAREILPNPTPAECVRFALRFCSDPGRFDEDDPTTWPTHSTGAAVDLTLRELKSGRLLYMGGIYLDPSEKSSTRFYEKEPLPSERSELEARRNRRLLYHAMVAVGFVNYPYEWWHFDYLTQASLMNLGFPPGLKAHYGLANAGKAPSADRRKRR
jgi:D-alanyl-D-alanine dipeptidase